MCDKFPKKVDFCSSKYLSDAETGYQQHGRKFDQLPRGTSTECSKGTYCNHLKANLGELTLRYRPAIKHPFLLVVNFILIYNF